MTAPSPRHAPSLSSWLRATWAGWLLGLPCIILLALGGEALGIGGTQVLVGAGMGMGVGLLQGRAVRRYQLSAAPWFWSCVAGLALPFLISDIGHAAGVTWSYSLPACVAIGGLLVGAWQAILLRRRFNGPLWWVLGSGLGWSLAGSMAMAADQLFRSHRLHGLAGAGAFLGIIAVGGLGLGLVTGLVLVHRLRPAAA